MANKSFRIAAVAFAMTAGSSLLVTASAAADLKPETIKAWNVAVEETERRISKEMSSDRGFFWRMNSYWRYQQVDGGVMVECESMTLSRSIPFPVEHMVRPMIKGTARESLHRTRESMRTRMTGVYKIYAKAQRHKESNRLATDD